MAFDSLASPSPLVRRLTSIYPLDEAERQALTDLPMQIREIRGQQDIVREGDRPSRSCLLLEGFMFRYKSVGEDGRRQIVSFYVPGDIPDLMSLHLAVMDNSVCTLMSSKVGFIEHQSLRKLIRDHPRIGDAFWRDTLIDASVFREWLVGIGRRNAHARIAHLLCELFCRLKAIDLADGNCIPLPVTQETMSDALGLSAVHVNRVVQALRAAQLISWRGRVLTVRDWEGLMQAGEFDPAYLHLRGHDD